MFSEPDLSTALARLAATADTSAIGLEAVFADLAADARAAVPSYLGMTVTADTTAGPVTFTALDEVQADDPPTARASLDLTVTVPANAGHGVVTVTLYAGAVAGFAALAAELAADLTNVGRNLPIAVTIDRHTGLLPTATGPDLESAAVVDRAVGVLVDRGQDPDAALAWLRECPGPGAAFRAREVLDSLVGPPDEPGARAGPGG